MTFITHENMVFFFNSIQGNEARQFGIEDGSYTFTATPTDPVYTTFEDFHGNLVQFVGKKVIIVVYVCILLVVENFQINFEDKQNLLP